MRHACWVALLLTVVTCAKAAEPAVEIAFVDVNVIPMDRERVLPHQTVLVRGDTIAWVAPAASASIPRDAHRIEGHGTAFVLPGLADMHTHVRTPEDLLLYVANGVTTVLHMGSDWMPPIRFIRNGIADGAIVGPQMFFSLKVDGRDAKNSAWKVDSAETARLAVRWARSGGFDFIKVYNELTEPEFDALVDEAHKTGLAVVGHGVRAVGLPNALFKGQVMVAHAEEFLYTAFGYKMSETAIPDVVEKTFQSRAYVTPTLSTYQAIAAQFGKPEVVQQYLRDPRSRYMSLEARAVWRRQGYANGRGDLSSNLAFLRRFTKAAADRGVPLMTGTDSPDIPGLIPGYAIHDELEALVKAGLTPFEALSAATRVPGEFISRHAQNASQFGTVTSGTRADLVVVAEDPLRSLDALKMPIGVMYGGRWKSTAALHELLDSNKRLLESAF